MLKPGTARRAIARTAATVALVGGTALTGTSTAHAASNPFAWYMGYSYTFASWYDQGCLDDSDAYGLRSYPCNTPSIENGYQKWKVINWSSGYAQLQNQATGRCLDWSPGAGLRTFPCYADSFTGGWQEWKWVNRTTADGRQEEVLQNGRWQDGEAWQCLDDSAYGVRGYPCNGPSQDNGYQGWNISNSTWA
ncbi:hypothetical protein A6P39_004305 [Streptomyces sp. FXJ1.172]|uniref:RICIN domain-containing protein n=1 Tax=Streptomyces sp. FXJ1.172 TaxID=710705 RepID=UPI0007CF5758|nr:hypothetical protein [Streptomyces sp. FXJ1.172]WEP00501.1 hypothetical protein A6P39_004305 [Streptomyces sp. FXJ1.172]